MDNCKYKFKKTTNNFPILKGKKRLTKKLIKR